MNRRCSSAFGQVVLARFPYRIVKRRREARKPQCSQGCSPRFKTYPSRDRGRHAPSRARVNGFSPVSRPSSRVVVVGDFGITRHMLANFRNGVNGALTPGMPGCTGCPSPGSARSRTRPRSVARSLRLEGHAEAVELAVLQIPASPGEQLGGCAARGEGATRVSSAKTASDLPFLHLESISYSQKTASSCRFALLPRAKRRPAWWGRPSACAGHSAPPVLCSGRNG
jgi:hypothetical protein